MKFKFRVGFGRLLALVLVASLGSSAFGGDPKAATCRVQVGVELGTGTCVWSGDGVSVVATTNHFSGGEARVTTPAGVMYGTLLPGDARSDTALVVVVGTLPVAEIRADRPTPGEVVRHFGSGSGGGSGTVVHVGPTTSFCDFLTTAPSVSGDSGAGIFDSQGRLVAVHRGRYDPHGVNLQCGGGVTEVLNALGRVGTVQVVERTVGGQTIRYARPKNATTVTPVASQPVLQFLPATSRCANGVCR